MSLFTAPNAGAKSARSTSCSVHSHHNLKRVPTAPKILEVEMLDDDKQSDYRSSQYSYNPLRQMTIDTLSNDDMSQRSLSPRGRTERDASISSGDYRSTRSAKLSIHAVKKPAARPSSTFDFSLIEPTKSTQVKHNVH